MKFFKIIFLGLLGLLFVQAHNLSAADSDVSKAVLSNSAEVVKNDKVLEKAKTSEVSTQTDSIKKELPLVEKSAPVSSEAVPSAVKSEDIAKSNLHELERSVTKAAEEPAKIASGDAVSENEPVVLKPGHHILIRIYPEDEFIKGGDMEVSAEGTITLPLVGKVKVSDKKIAEAEKDIVRILDADYLANPEVSIELRREKENAPVSTKNFVILGQVRKPGTFPIPLEVKKFTLLQAISLGGGFTEIANIKRVKLVHKTGNNRTTVQVNVEEIFNGSAPDVEVQNGDVIHVPESIF